MFWLVEFVGPMESWSAALPGGLMIFPAGVRVHPVLGGMKVSL